MKFAIGLEVLRRGLELGVLGRVVAGEVAVLVVAKYLHLPRLGSDAPVSGVCRIHLGTVSASVTLNKMLHVNLALLLKLTVSLAVCS